MLLDITRLGIKLFHLKKQKHCLCTTVIIKPRTLQSSRGQQLSFPGSWKLCYCDDIMPFLFCYWRAMCSNLPPTCEMSSHKNEHQTPAWFKIGGNPASCSASMDKYGQDNTKFDVTCQLLLTVAAKFLSTSVRIVFNQWAQHWNSILQMSEAVWNKWQSTEWAKHDVSCGVFLCLFAPMMASICTHVPCSEYYGIWVWSSMIIITHMPVYICMIWCVYIYMNPFHWIETILIYGTVNHVLTVAHKWSPSHDLRTDQWYSISGTCRAQPSGAWLYTLFLTSPWLWQIAQGWSMLGRRLHSWTCRKNRSSWFLNGIFWSAIRVSLNGCPSCSRLDVPCFHASEKTRISRSGVQSLVQQNALTPAWLKLWRPLIRCHH